MEELFKLISNYGFPIVVSIYLLFRQEKKMEELSKTITGRNGILDKLDEIYTSTVKNRRKK